MEPITVRPSEAEMHERIHKHPTLTGSDYVFFLRSHSGFSFALHYAARRK